MLNLKKLMAKLSEKTKIISGQLDSLWSLLQEPVEEFENIGFQNDAVRSIEAYHAASAAGLSTKPFFDSKNGNIKIYQNDAISFLKSLPDSSVDLITTDPAYSGMNQMLKLGKGKIIGTYKEKGENGAKWFGEFHDTEKNYTEFLKECKSAEERQTYLHYVRFIFFIVSCARSSSNF